MSQRLGRCTERRPDCDECRRSFWRLDSSVRRSPWVGRARSQPDNEADVGPILGWLGQNPGGLEIGEHRLDEISGTSRPPLILAYSNHHQVAMERQWPTLTVEEIQLGRDPNDLVVVNHNNHATILDGCNGIGPPPEVAMDDLGDLDQQGR